MYYYINVISDIEIQSVATLACCVVYQKDIPNLRGYTQSDVLFRNSEKCTFKFNSEINIIIYWELIHVGYKFKSLIATLKHG